MLVHLTRRRVEIGQEDRLKINERARENECFKIWEENNQILCEALQLVRRLKRKSLSFFSPSGFLVSSLIAACDRSGCMFGEGIQVHGFAIKVGLLYDVFVGSCLLHFYGAYKRVFDAQRIFEKMPERNVVSWTSLMFGYLDNGDFENVMYLYQEMRKEEISCNENTFATVIAASCSCCKICSVDNLKWGKEIHSLVIKLGLDSNVCTCNSLLCMYSEGGRLDDAEFVFKEMPERDLISWNSMMTCYVRGGRSLYVLKILNEMLQMKKTINYVTFMSALAACSNSVFIAKGKIVQALVILSGLHENLAVGNTTITMYAKSGTMVEAKKVFQMMPKRNLVTWNALIGGLVENEEPDEAVKAFQLMREVHCQMFWVLA
ncbi:hypothetical protein J1N35_020812 [Gossypium stocksii]|uniref:Pentatricopeptide repeat-containing protein n=1 Tax=Gossypium stocksii TaxID=47602 RepID=A0A9D3ZZL6_9ROSI|nr:hypothetical protein J1N35_020812 [Gossypium stocksii]